MHEQRAAAEALRPRRFRPYPAYKDSGIEWLGEIPAHWEPAKMWRICTATSGGTPKDEHRYWNGEIPWVSPKDMKRRFIDSSEDTITDQAVAETGIKLIAPPVVLIVVRGMILAHTFPVAITTVPVTINQDMKALSFRKDIDPLFAAWLLDGIGTGILGATVEEAAHGTRVIRMDQWRAVVAPIPPQGEQRTMVKFLTRETARIDALVAKKERLIELLQEKRTALITRAVTKGLDPNVPMKDSGVEWLGEIPAHWDAAKMWRICSATSGGTPSKDEHRYWDGEVPWVSPKDMKRRFIESSEDTITEQAVAETGLKLIAPPTVLIVVRGMILAHTFPVAITTVPVTINQDMKALGFRKDIDPFFAAWLLGGIEEGILGATVEEAAHGTRVIRMDQWRSVVAPVPPTREQRAIANFLDRETARHGALVAKVCDAIDRLKELRTALISAAVTGKIDVRGEIA